MSGTHYQDVRQSEGSHKLFYFVSFSFFFSSHKHFPLLGFEEVGCVSTLRYQEAVRVRDSLQDALAALQALALSTHTWRKKLPDMQMSEGKNAVLT